MDELSKVHFKAVRTEIEGRFFSQEEADEQKRAVDIRTITDPKMRAVAVTAWEDPKSL